MEKNNVPEFELLDQTKPKKCNPVTEYIKHLINTKIDKFSQVSGFTLTLKKKYHDDDSVWIHRYIHAKILKSSVWKDKNYILIPEFTKAGNLHYHGIIWDHYDITVMRCIKWWRREFGYAKPELELRNYKNWSKYILKNYLKTGLWTIFNEIAGAE